MTFKEIDAGWKPPDGLGYSSLRPVRLTVAGYLMVVLMVVFIIGSVVLGTFLFDQSQRQQAERDRLQRDGVLTQAVIIRLWRSGGKETTPYVRYRFLVNGSEVVGTSRTPKRRWATLRIGDSLPIRYVAAAPAFNHPADWDANVTPPWLGLTVGVIFVGVAALFFLLLRRQWQLLGEGRPAPGIVSKTRRTDKTVVVTYEFRLPNGSTHTGKSNVSSRNIPGQGSQVCVLYDADNPRRNALYPFCLVRLEGTFAKDAPRPR